MGNSFDELDQNDNVFGLLLKKALITDLFLFFY